MHTALLVLAATSVVGAGVTLLRPRHAGHAGEERDQRERAAGLSHEAPA